MNHLTVQQLSAALDGALTGPSLESVVHHLAHCHECRDRQARLARHDDMLRRLLAQDAHDVFLDDLERRTEALLLAIMRGLPVPPMVTSTPLPGEEDAGETGEPPLPERPELGLAGVLAHQAGFGRIGVKPTGSTQAPDSDATEAQRLLEAAERGLHLDPGELPSPAAHAAAELEEAAFDLPDWVKHGQAARTPPRPPSGQAAGADLVLDPLVPHAGHLPRAAVGEHSHHGPGPDAAALDAPPPAAASGPGPASEAPAPHSHARYMPPARPSPVQASPTGSGGAPAGAPQSLRSPDELEPRPLRGDDGEQPPRFSTRTFVVPKELREAAQRTLEANRPRAARPAPPQASEPAPPSPPVVRDVPPAPRLAGAWLLATASVGSLLVLVLGLQFLPPADAPGPGAWRGFQLPQVRFVRGDSLEVDDVRPATPELRSANTPHPIEVPVDLVPEELTPRDSLLAGADSLVTPTDSLGAMPGR